MQFTPEQEEYFSAGKTSSRQGELSREQIETLNQMLKESYSLAQVGSAIRRGVSSLGSRAASGVAAAGRGAANLGSSALTAARGQINSLASKAPLGGFLTKQRSIPTFLGGKPAPSIVQQADDAALGAAGQSDDVAQRSVGRADDVAQTSIPRSNPVQRVNAVPQTQPLSPATRAPQPQANVGTGAQNARAQSPLNNVDESTVKTTPLNRVDESTVKTTPLNRVDESTVKTTPLNRVDDAAQASARPVNAQPPTTQPVVGQAPNAGTSLPAKGSPEFNQMRENLKAQRNAFPKGSPEAKAVQKQINDLERTAPRAAKNPAQATQTPAAPNAAGGAADDAAQASARPVNAQPPTTQPVVGQAPNAGTAQAAQASAAPNATAAAQSPLAPGLGGMTVDDAAAFKTAVGDDTYNFFFGNTLREGAKGKYAPNWMKNLWTGRGVTARGRADDLRSVQALLTVEAEAIAATRGGIGTAVTNADRVAAAKAIELSVKGNRVRPTELLRQYQSTGTSISTNAVSPASSQGRQALAAQQVADEAAAVAKAEAGKGNGLMEWANKNPIPAAILGGAGILALPRLVNGGGGSTIVT